MGHLEPVPPADLVLPDSKHYYLPHHCVFKEASTTTKLRVVFDGSAKTEPKGPSLNDTLMVGPKIQDDLFDIILRFRLHRVALSADVAKMYRQVKLDADHRDFHRILWRFKPSEPIQHLRMTRVTYGLASSAYHAVSCLQAVVSNETDKDVARAIIEDFYMDDLLSGSSSTQSALSLVDGLVTCLASGGFPLRKWSSNDPDVIAKLPVELRETADECVFRNPDYNLKTLGVKWSPNPDVFTFSLSNDANITTFTRRSLLSDTSRLFDPMGWLAPVTIKIKCMLQKTWLTQLDWDDPLPEAIQQEWLQWRGDFPLLADIKLPRCAFPVGDSYKISLHMFSDASESAYGACVYSSIADGRSTRISLIAAKTRVAPVKTISLPRLELCGAQLGIRLLRRVQDNFSKLALQVDATHAWTDSTIVLAWLKETPKTWCTFVANRVSDIHQHLRPTSWRHVPTNDNPADCASRGLNFCTIPYGGLVQHGWPKTLLFGPETLQFTTIHQKGKFKNLSTFVSKFVICSSLKDTRIWRNCRVWLPGASVSSTTVATKTVSGLALCTTKSELKDSSGY